MRQSKRDAVDEKVNLIECGSDARSKCAARELHTDLWGVPCAPSTLRAAHLSETHAQKVTIDAKLRALTTPNRCAQFAHAVIARTRIAQ